MKSYGMPGGGYVVDIIKLAVSDDEKGRFNAVVIKRFKN